MHEDRDWISRSPPTGPERMLQGCLSCCFESWPPNGSRLSCGRNARRRKEVEPQTKRLAGEATQFFPQEAPVSFKRLLGGSGTVIQNTNHVCVRDFVRPVLTRDELYEPKRGRERFHEAPKPDARWRK